MTTVGVYFQHGFVGKASQSQAYTARAHSRYIQRQSATQSVHTYLMPESYEARQRWFFDHENALRKNGRVIDKFIIAIPRDVTADHAVNVLDKFGRWLGQERCPFMFTLQGFDGHNHHAHMIFIDKDYETGKRVFGTTLRNSTQNIKLEWERVANSFLEEQGYDVRVKAHQHEELQAENDNTPQEKAAQPVAPEEIPQAVEEPVEDTGDGDGEAMVTNDVIGVDPIEAVRFLHEQRGELEYLRRCREAMLDAQERHKWLVAERDKLAVEAGKYEQDSLPTLMAASQAQESLKDHQTKDGGLKGRSLSVFGYTLFRSKARKQAEEAYGFAREKQFEANQVTHTRRSYDVKLDQLLRQAEQAAQKAHAHEALLEQLYGSSEDVDASEQAIIAGIRDSASLVTFDQAAQFYENGDITADQYRTYLLERGYAHELELLDDELGRDQAQSL